MYKRIPQNLKKKRGPKGPSKYTQEFIEKEAIALSQYAEESPLPFLNKFTVDRGYYPDIITRPEWIKNEKFLKALKTAKALLEYKLTVGCLANKLNPAMAIFALKNVAGWRDGAYLEHSGTVKNGEGTKIIIVRDAQVKAGEEIKKDGNNIQANAEANTRL